MLSLTRWNPFQELNNLHRAVNYGWGDRFDQTVAGRDWPWVPATEVSSDDDGWTVRIALPGVTPKDVQVDLRDTVVTVKGERASKPGSSIQSVSEFGYGTFERSFTLPASADASKVRATFDHGMLELRLPLAETSKPRRIAIDGA